MARDSINGFRRFLFWVGYDGNFFQEMPKCATRRSVIECFELCLAHCIGCRSNDFRISPASRTDKYVHAIRSPLIVHMPSEHCWIDETDVTKRNLIGNFNSLTTKIAHASLNLLDFHAVSPGFDPRSNVSYRKYVYRIIVPKNRGVFNEVLKFPTLASFSETYYSWLIYPSFDLYKAQQICQIFQSNTLNFASFFRHSDSYRRRGIEYRSTITRLKLMQIEPGEPYCIQNDDFEYYNIAIVSRSFIREQIRRMIAVLVNIACGRQPMDFLYRLLKCPDPKTFFKAGGHIIAAPPGGLYLADVVYDPRMYEKPVPYYYHAWDDFPLVNGGEE